MPTEKFKPYVAVWLILERDQKILLMRRFQTGWGDGQYGLPAGHLEENEGLTQAMIREAKEETDLELTPGQLFMAHVAHRKTPEREYLDFFFVAKNFAKDAQPRNTEPEKCDDMRWFPADDLPENTLPSVISALNAIKNHQHYDEFGW